MKDLRHARWVARAARAPSPHNCQPARWRIRGDTVELCEDTRRWLAVGDGTGRDNSIALGMAWEAMVIAMSHDGFGLLEPQRMAAPYPPADARVRCRARATMVVVTHEDPLAPEQARRACHRGLFRPCTDSEAERLRGCLQSHQDIAVKIPATAATAMADAAAHATAALMGNGTWVAELRAWLRLSPEHPDLGRDGLSAACLGLGRFEAFAAACLLRPRMAELLARTGIGRTLLGERREILSASALVAIVAAPGMDDFDTGRHWYRFWLALTAAGFAAVPMSMLVDVDRQHAFVAKQAGLSAGARLCNVMRIGPMPVADAIRSARLPRMELLLGPCT